MSKEEMAVAKDTLEKAGKLSAQAQELIDTYAEGVMAGLRLGKGLRDETVQKAESKDG